MDRYLLILSVACASSAQDTNAANARVRQLVRRRRQVKRTKVATFPDGMNPPSGGRSTVGDEDMAFWGRQLASSVATNGDSAHVGPNTFLKIGTYEDQFGVLVHIEKDSITISYECLEGYEDHSPYKYTIFPEYTSLADKGNEVSVITYEDENENDKPDAGEYSTFDFTLDDGQLFDFTLDDGQLYYCTIDYGEQTVDLAIASEANAIVSDLEGGCNTFPWSKLHVYDGTC